jgi:hypothetical protein
LKEGVLDKENGVAYGSFMDNIESTGWSNLDIRSGYGSNSVDDVTIMYVAISGHCSVMVKATPGYEDILAGHSTWSLYPLMLRVFKHYSFNLKEPTTGSRIMSFSSYPGALTSIDDYYILGSGLIVMETTNGIYNNSLFKMVMPESLLSWQRIRAASQMASDATEWTDTVAKYNSGTYNNQYIVIDLNKIKLKNSIEDNTLRIAEQIPG